MDTPLQGPRAPTSLEASGLSLDLVIQLVLKTLDDSGELSAMQLANQLGLLFPVIEPAVDALRAQRLCEIVGGATNGSLLYRYRITSLGRERAAEYLSRNRYVGIAPVTLAQYRAYMTSFRATTSARRIAPERVHQALSHLVLRDAVVEQLGAAMNSGRSLFVYGPPGNGKTVISQALGNLYDEDLWIPHAIDVPGSLIQIFDPFIHEARPPADDSGALDDAQRCDARWVRCRRPVVTVGGELTLQALDLSAAGNGGFYRAPVQIVANGGVLVIDDFGRQRCSPAELLNRWIAPLESHVDHLVLHSGQTVEMPFMVLVVFATNLRPADLLDEAFLRRIHYKVFLPSPTSSELSQIFENCCAEQKITFDPALIDYLLEQIYLPRGIPMRCCQPRDLIDHAMSMAQYRNMPRTLTPELLESACASYFIDEPAEPAPRYAMTGTHVPQNVR